MFLLARIEVEHESRARLWKPFHKEAYATQLILFDCKSLKYESVTLTYW